MFQTKAMKAGIVTFILFLTLVGGDSSYNDTLMKQLKFEQIFIKDLESYIDSQESVLQLLRKKLLNFKVEHSEATDNPEVYFSNELNKFLLLKRLASDVELLSDKTFDVADKFKSKVNLYKHEHSLPSKSDLMMSALSIAGLQKAQGLKTDKLAKGIFGNVKRR
jgi:Prolyl 4-Hydroxylase alpha-subunit, N-terminal region